MLQNIFNQSLTVVDSGRQLLGFLYCKLNNDDECLYFLEFLRMSALFYNTSCRQL